MQDFVLVELKERVELFYPIVHGHGDLFLRLHFSMWSGLYALCRCRRGL